MLICSLSKAFSAIWSITIQLTLVIIMTGWLGFIRLVFCMLKDQFLEVVIGKYKVNIYVISIVNLCQMSEQELQKLWNWWNN